MTYVRAIACIYRNPTRRMIATGRFDDDGNAILSADPDIHKPGDLFEISDPAELSELAEQGAIEILEDGDQFPVENSPPVALALSQSDEVEALWGISAADRRRAQLANSKPATWEGVAVHAPEVGL